MKKKSSKVEVVKSFDAFYYSLNEPDYPFLLATNVSKSNSQYEKSRSFKLLGDWVKDY
jgi:hypothetical protein